MSNELQIENIKLDNMNGEIHSDSRCKTENRIGIYRDIYGRNFNVLVIFMVCQCGKKSKNPLPIFDGHQSISEGESVDIHLPDKGCNYKSHHQADGTFKFKRFCCCLPSLSYPGS